MATVAELNVAIGAEIGDLDRKMRQAEKSIRGVGSAAEAADRETGAAFSSIASNASRGSSSLASFSGAARDVGGNLTAFVTVPLGLLAGAALKSASDIQALEKGFQATLKPGEDFATNLAKVQKLAQLPGLGLQEALQGATNLQAAGYSADLAQRSLAAFGNALATVGKGKADLDGVGLALGQIASKGKISAEEINQLAERVPQIRAAMKAAFGTADTDALSKAKISATDFVEGVTRELEKLPKVTGGLKNAFENLSDGAVIALAKLGDAGNRLFDVEGILNGLGSTVQGLVSRFESLDPSTQKLIFLLAGVVAAAGPVLVVVGSIGAAIPALAAGFAALTGPIGLAVVALAALVAAGVAYAASTEDAVGAFRRQKSAVDELEKGVNPLLKRYDELKSQTKLTKAEQEELRSIVQKVGEQIPTSITQFDAYGKAMDISSEAARRFVQQQREILAIKNKDALKEQREAYKELSAQIKGAQNALSTFDAQGRLVKAVFDEGGGGFVRLTAEEITRLQARLQDLLAQRRGVGGLIDELKGITPVLKEANAAGPVTPVIDAEASKKAEDMRKALDKLQESLRVNGQLSNLLGKDYDFIGERQKILEGGVKSLIEAGYAPASAAVRKYADELRLLNSIQAGAATKPLQISVPTTVTPQVQNGTAAGLDAGLKTLGDYRNQLQSLERQTNYLPLPQFAADGLKQIQADSAAYVAALESLTPAQLAALDAQALFNTEMETLLSDIGPQFSNAIGAIASSFGEAAGAIAAGGASFGDGLGMVFNGILTALAGFIGQFGQQLIAIGIGKLALDNLFAAGPAGGPAAIAAGIGLVALAGVAKAVAANSSRSLGNITGVGGGGGRATPTAPTTQRVEAQKLNITVKFEPVEFRQDGPSLRAALNVDEYRVKRFS